MIKAENYGKITGNYRNLPENSLKTLKNGRRASHGGWGGGPGFAGQEGFANFFDDRGCFWLTPPLWPCLDKISILKRCFHLNIFNFDLHFKF